MKGCHKFCPRSKRFLQYNFTILNHASVVLPTWRLEFLSSLDDWILELRTPFFAATVFLEHSPLVEAPFHSKVFSLFSNTALKSVGC